MRIKIGFTVKESNFPGTINWFINETMYPSKGYKFPQKISCNSCSLYALQRMTQLGKLERSQQQADLWAG